jgi:BTB/POZ domain
MQGPRLLPSHLVSYTSYDTDEELVCSLMQRAEDLVLFFESACKDEAWFCQHAKFFRLLLRQVTKQFYLGNLSIYHARRIVKIIQTRYSLLQPFLFFRAALFFTIKLKVENQDILVNSFLFGVCSPVLRSIFKNKCFKKLEDEWVLEDVRLAVFRQIETYISNGKIPTLREYRIEDILTLMEQAKAWGLKGLVNDCAAVLHLK